MYANMNPLRISSTSGKNQLGWAVFPPSIIHTVKIFPNSNNCFLIFSNTASPRKDPVGRNHTDLSSSRGLAGNKEAGFSGQLTAREPLPLDISNYFNNVIFFVAANPSACRW